MKVPILPVENYGVPKATLIKLLKENRDPLPKKPEGNPRELMSLDEQKLAVFPGEYIRVTVSRSQKDVNGYERECIFRFPSGAEWDSKVMGSELEKFLADKIGFDKGFIRKLVPYILNNKVIAIFPNEKLMRSIVPIGKDEVFI